MPEPQPREANGAFRPHYHAPALRTDIRAGMPSPGNEHLDMPAAISNAVVQIVRDYTGRGPTKARTTITGDSVTCVLGDNLTSSWTESGGASAGRESADVLLRALAERDPQLRLHLDGVAKLACVTAKLLGVPNDDMEVTRQTALLHDIGKVAFPDEILSKPGPLDDVQWAFMKRHTIIGERIISADPALAVVSRTVRSTHERYDGSGYPDGLAGDAIPLMAQIVAVGDAYDAMVTERVYQQARSRPEATIELQRCGGTQFDPKVVEAFLAALDAEADGEDGAQQHGPVPGPAARLKGNGRTLGMDRRG